MILKIFVFEFECYQVNAVVTVCLYQSHRDEARQPTSAYW